MSVADVYEVFGPIYERQAELATESLRRAETCVLSLRRLLRANDPSLPNEYDGAAWYEIEKEAV